MIKLKPIRDVFKIYNDIFFDEALNKNLLNLLIENYQNRAYHNLEHIVDCLKTFNNLKKIKYKNNVSLQKNEESALVCAILFHDIIYGAKQEISDEKLSANMFEDFMSNYSSNQHFIATVKELILSTEHLKNDFDPIYAPKHLIELMADIDLSILSAKEDKYKKYSDGVRLEYAHVDDNVFYRGRYKVLLMLKDKAEKNILYRTEEFKKKNKVAKANIENELQEIQSKLYLTENKKTFL